MRFAFYGRVSTEDNQDPTSSRQRQLWQAKNLIEPYEGEIVEEFFDIGKSRSLPWKRRPEASRLLQVLPDTNRGFDAVVVGEAKRAFYSNQASLVLPLFDHYGVGFWLPEIGGAVDPTSTIHELMLGLDGGMGKDERKRNQVRVRSAMTVQAKHEGRFLGGRPPYGYRLIEVGPHPNPRKDGIGQRLRQLEPDPETAPVVQRIFQQYLSGEGIQRIAESLTRDGIPSPSGHDPKRNPHRQWSRGSWSKSAVRTILRNPRYTGHQVWNRQRRDEVLLDIKQVDLGYRTKFRWNDPEEWIVSDQKTHQALIDEETFRQAQAQASTGSHRRANRQRSTGRPYTFRGMLLCGVCGRRMQGHWNNSIPHYRCRFPTEYAGSELIDHPKNVYLRQDAVEPALDQWLTQLFDPSNIDETCRLLSESDDTSTHQRNSHFEKARERLRDCDRRLGQYRMLLDQGTDPKLVADWIADVQAQRSAAEQDVARLRPEESLNPHQIRQMVDAIEDKVKLLADADPATKAALYSSLGVRLTYHPDRQTVVVESQPTEIWVTERVGEGT